MITCVIASPSANVPVIDLTVTTPVPAFQSVTIADPPVPFVITVPVANVPDTPVKVIVPVDLEDTNL